MKTWKPNKAQRADFARRMADPTERAAYEQRKQDRADRRRAGSRFDYEKAGGEYVPTREQYLYAVTERRNMTGPEKDAADRVIFSHVNNEKCHHDDIHVINELRRAAYSAQIQTT